MKDFGFKLHIDRQLDFDLADLRIANYVRTQEPSFNTCIQCGTCSATCSASIFTDFNPRRLYLDILRGDIKNVKANIDKCMFCGKCQLACPRAVNTRNVIFNIHKAVELIKNNKLL